MALGVFSTNLVVLGTSVNPFSGIASAMLLYFIPIYFALIVYLITIGGLLGIYIPLVLLFISLLEQ